MPNIFLDQFSINITTRSLKLGQRIVIAQEKTSSKKAQGRTLGVPERIVTKTRARKRIKDSTKEG